MSYYPGDPLVVSRVLLLELVFAVYAVGLVLCKDVSLVLHPSLHFTLLAIIMSAAALSHHGLQLQMRSKTRGQW